MKILIKLIKKGIAMQIIKLATAGTMESSDAYVEVEPLTSGVEIEIQSVVYQQFGDSIRQSVLDVINEEGVTSVRVRIVDRGALDPVIRARVRTAIRRGGDTV